MRGSSLLLLILPLSGCAHFWAPPPDVPRPLKPTDERRPIVGTWRLMVFVDSLLPGSPRAQSPIRQYSECLRIADSLASPLHPYLYAILERPLGALGTPPTPTADSMPANAPGAASDGDLARAKRRLAQSPSLPLSFGGHAIDVERRKDQWIIGLTPGVFDYFFGLSGRFVGDSLAGVWHEVSQGQTFASGHFTMQRIDSAGRGLTRACS